MTDKDIIKALECCIKETSDCDHCPLFIPADADCFNISKSGALDIIYRLQAENDRLNSCVKSEDEVRAIMKAQMEPMVKEITNEQIDIAVKLARVDATLEFANKLLNEIDDYHYVINRIVKEMVGEE